MAPTDSIELEHGQKENEKAEEPVTHGGKCELNEQEEMVTSFIEASPTIEADRSLPVVDEEKKIDNTQIAVDQTSLTDPGEGTSGQEKCKSVVINVSDEKPKSERAVNGNQVRM